MTFPASSFSAYVSPGLLKVPSLHHLGHRARPVSPPPLVVMIRLPQPQSPPGGGKHRACRQDSNHWLFFSRKIALCLYPSRQGSISSRRIGSFFSKLWFCQRAVSWPLLGTPAWWSWDFAWAAVARPMILYPVMIFLDPQAFLLQLVDTGSKQSFIPFICGFSKPVITAINGHRL